MSDCDCEKSNMNTDWPDERDVGDRFLRMDETPLISSIKSNILRSNVNKNAIFNRKMEEDKLDDLDIENVIIDYSFVDDEKEDTLIDYDVSSDMEEEQTNYDDDDEMVKLDDDEIEKIEEDDVVETGGREITVQDPEILVGKTKTTMRNKISDYLDDFL